MSVLSDLAILQAIDKGDIEITPFNYDNLGSNSYDLTLQPTLLQYTGDVLEIDKPNETVEINIPEDGYILLPGNLYLAATNEFTLSKIHRPKVEGKSSLGRLGLEIHRTAGYGDISFGGTWTLEMSVLHPLRIKPNMKIAQIEFSTVEGECIRPYGKKKSSKYQGQISPTASKMHENYTEITKDRFVSMLEDIIKENNKSIQKDGLVDLLNKTGLQYFLDSIDCKNVIEFLIETRKMKVWEISIQTFIPERILYGYLLGEEAKQDETNDFRAQKHHLEKLKRLLS